MNKRTTAATTTTTTTTTAEEDCDGDCDDVLMNECEYLIHYCGWESRWDEWVRRGRLRWPPQQQRHQQQQQQEQQEQQEQQQQPHGISFSSTNTITCNALVSE